LASPNQGAIIDMKGQDGLLLEDWMKLFWTILKPLPLEWSLHWWRKNDLMITMLIKAGTCAFHVVTTFRKCILSLWFML